MNAKHGTLSGPLLGSLKTLFRDFEDVRFYDNAELGFSAIIAVHDTTLGPSLGGCRRMAYPSLWGAYVDVARLAKGMTYKAALIDYTHGGIPLGGGKCVMIPRNTGKRLRNAQFRALGAFIDTLGGTYISAEDVGTSVHDVREMRKETEFVSGIMKGHPYDGNPSVFTAEGVYYGMLGALRAIHGPSAYLSGRSVYIEGIGKVGFTLMKLLRDAGAVVCVSNRTETASEKDALLRAQEEFGAVNVPLGADGLPIVFPLCEIYAPCALGGVVSDARIRSYPSTVKIIAGAANNVLLDPARDGALLCTRGIVYAPDYVINNRGLWDVYHQVRAEREGIPYVEETVLAGCKDNEGLLFDIVSHALHGNKCPHVVADAMAQSVLDKKNFEFMS